MCRDQSAAMEQKISKTTVYGSLAGGVFGSLCWLVVMAGMVGDWLSMVTIAVLSAALFFAGARLWLRRPQRQHLVVAVVMAAVGILNLLVIHLRWNEWMAVYRQSARYTVHDDLPIWSLDLFIVAVCGTLCLVFVGMDRRMTRCVHDQG